MSVSEGSAFFLEPPEIFQPGKMECTSPQESCRFSGIWREAGSLETFPPLQGECAPTPASRPGGDGGGGSRAAQEMAGIIHQPLGALCASPGSPAAASSLQVLPLPLSRRLASGKDYKQEQWPERLSSHLEWGPLGQGSPLHLPGLRCRTGSSSALPAWGVNRGPSGSVM